MGERCKVCGLPLAARMEDGCVPGNCSMRPRPITFPVFEDDVQQLYDIAKRLQAENDQLREVLERLVLEAMHYYSTGIGSQHLADAIDAARAALEEVH